MYIHTPTAIRLSEADIRARFPLTYFAWPFVPPEDYVRIIAAAVPEHDPVTHEAVETAAVQLGGAWVQQWELVALAPATVAARREALEVARIAALWQAAHAVEYAEISGSAVGLITLGVLQAKPKCLVVQGWIQALWTEYYARKASGSGDLDFSAFAACPHTVPAHRARADGRAGPGRMSHHIARTA